MGLQGSCLKQDNASLTAPLFGCHTSKWHRGNLSPDGKIVTLSGIVLCTSANASTRKCDYMHTLILVSNSTIRRTAKLYPSVLAIMLCLMNERSQGFRLVLVDVVRCPGLPLSQIALIENDQRPLATCGEV